MRMSRRMGVYSSGGGPIWFFDGDNGGDVTKNTGGWTHYGTSGSSGTGEHDEYEIIVGADSSSTSGGKDGAAQTVNYINFDRLTTLYFHVKTYNSLDEKLMGVLTNGAVGSFVAYVSPNATGWFTVDVSTITGEYQIGMHVHADKNGDGGYLYIDKVYAE